MFLIGVLNLIYSIIDFDFWLLRYVKKDSASFNKTKYNLKTSSKKYGKFVKWLRRLISCVGYREYYYCKSGSKEQAEDNVKTSRGRYYFKSCLDVSYNDRAFKNLYSCKDKDFLEPENLDLEMSKEELNKMLGRTD